jgi:hypothetical protein
MEVRDSDVWVVSHPKAGTCMTSLPDSWPMFIAPYSDKIGNVRRM